MKSFSFRTIRAARQAGKFRRQDPPGGTERKAAPPLSDAVLSLDRALRTVYTFWIHFLLRSNLMAHKKMERAKELDRRRHRRAQRIKERIREAKAAAKK